ncbi:uncharacterized protein LOC116609539 [Nematostella vectensis]|uniref:uncharacterized protein LOC116609539 n=1 Tax=Nematostella vectensis TaxID=45351 RepID=UPI002077164E|nr:uncharacterized protein LOC116609539 [Nematostella vectensis]
MGINGSKSEPATESIPALVPDSILPLNTQVKVHLVPKFCTSERTRFNSRYYLLVTVRNKPGPVSQNGQRQNTAIGCTELRTADKNSKHNLTANLEFKHRRLSNGGNDSFAGISAMRPQSLKGKPETSVEVSEVVIVEKQSIRISGLFRGSCHLPDITDAESFDLILCPSGVIDRMSTGPSVCWMLLGTLYTKLRNSKHEKQWKAAVKSTLN